MLTYNRRCPNLKLMILKMYLSCIFFGCIFYSSCILCQHQGTKIYTVPSLFVLDAYERTYFEIIQPMTLNYLFRIYPAKDFGTTLKVRLLKELHEFRPTRKNAVKISNDKSNMRSFTGKLILSDPLDGCTTFKNQNKMNGAAALVLRSGCSFLSKSINAENAGASFVIITDTVSSNDLLEMVKDDSGRNVNIPVAFLPGENGSHLVEALKKPETIGDIIITAPVNISSTDLLLRQPPWTLW